MADAGAHDHDRPPAFGWIALALGVLYVVSAPAVVNGDGLGYLRPLADGPPPVPGHLAYVPLLRLLHALCGPHTLAAARLVNAAAAVLGLLAVHRGVRSLVGARAAYHAATGLGLSYGWWVQAADVETYALAAAWLAGAFAVLAAWSARPTAARALAAGLLAAASALFHVTNVVFLLGLGLWLVTAPAPGMSAGRRAGHTALALGAAVAVVGAAYAGVAFGPLGLTPAGALAWFTSAGHGFTYLVRPYNLADAVVGMAKSFVFAPFAAEADVSAATAQLLLGLAPLGALLALVLRRRHALAARARLPWPALAGWALPYLVIGLLFFGNDSERWIFVLPLAWLVAAAALDTLPPARAARTGRRLAAYLLVANLTTAVLPSVLDSGPRWKAEAVEALSDPGDLIICPGHDWDEYIGFYDRRTPALKIWPLAYYVGRDGPARALELLEDDIRYARNRRGQVYVVRVLDAERERRGWEELGLLGLPQPAAAGYFRDHYDLTPLDPVRNVRLWRVEDTARAPARARRR